MQPLCSIRGGLLPQRRQWVTRTSSRHLNPASAAVQLGGLRGDARRWVRSAVCGRSQTWPIGGPSDAKPPLTCSPERWGRSVVCKRRVMRKLDGASAGQKNKGDGRAARCHEGGTRV